MKIPHPDFFHTKLYPKPARNQWGFFPYFYKFFHSFLSRKQSVRLPRLLSPILFAILCLTKRSWGYTQMSVWSNIKRIFRRLIYGNKPLQFPIYCKLHGVKKSTRQGSLAQSHEEDGLQLVHVPLQDYPHNVYAYSIPLNRVLGYLDKELAEQLIAEFGDGFCLDGRIRELIGGPPKYKYYGCKIRIYNTKSLMANTEDFTHLHGE